MLTLWPAFIGWGTAPITWSPTDHSANITISNGNRTATRGSLAISWVTARSDTSRSSGVRTVSFTINQVGSNGMMVGVCNAAADINNYAGFTDKGCSYWSIGNFIKNAAFTGTGPGAYTTGDTVSVRVDVDAHTFCANLNGGAFSPTVDITSLGADVYISCSLGNGATLSSVTVFE